MNREEAPDDGYGLVLACRRLHSVIDDIDAQIADAVGLTRNELRCLNMLEAEPKLARDIAEKTGLTTGSVTAMLDRLEQRSFIKRKPHPEDRRAMLVEITPQVFKRLGQMYRLMGDAVVNLSLNYGPRKTRSAAANVKDLSVALEEVLDTLRENEA
ncbi:MAG: MarR family transcriptional regulator [Pseudomonadota bacterium]